MDYQTLTRSKSLNNIPQKKLQLKLSSIDSSDEDFKIKATKTIAINRYSESNIPIEYWTLKMDRDFHGDGRLLSKYNDYVSDLNSSYLSGKSIFFAGPHGCGKTMTCANILKSACHKGYTALYTDLSSVVSTLTTAPNEEKFIARRELSLVDFLVIDEVDNRFMATDHAADLYARSLEGVFRTRSQNGLPIIMCTNSPNIVESLNGPLKESLDSLLQGYIEMFPVFGQDYRKNK